MAKGQSPLLGFNTNVRHKGRTFHIQTEDSGVQHPHVITHLFADGGRILKSVKTPYGELLESEDWATQVKKIMQDQHKAMFIALRDGQYDHLIDPSLPQTSSGQTGQHAAFLASGNTGANKALRSPSSPNIPVAAQPTAPAPVDPTAARPAPAAEPARTAASPSASNQPAVNAQAAKPAGAVTGARPAPAAAPNAPAGGANAGPPSTRSGRYAPVRSPDVLASFKSKNDGGSIFGEGMMSEKSLDEVILAYLAEDLDEKKG